MKKSIILGFMMVFALSFGARAETDAKALAIISDIQRGIDNNNQIQTLRVRDGITLPAASITAAEIATDAVGAAEIAASAVGTSEIADGSITNDDINANATIATSKLADTSPITPSGYAGRVKIQLGTITSTGEVTSIAFADAFGATPAVSVTAEAATTNIWYVTGLDANGFEVSGENGVNGGYIAVGLE